MIISRPDVQRVEPLGPVYLSRRLVVSDDPRWSVALRVSVVLVLVVLAAVAARWL